MKQKVKCEHNDDISKCPPCWTEFTTPYPPDQAAQEINDLLLDYGCAVEDAQKSERPIKAIREARLRAKAALLALMHQESLVVIGEDEDNMDVTGLAALVTVSTRNKLRAEQRQAAARRYGQEGGDRESK